MPSVFAMLVVVQVDVFNGGPTKVRVALNRGDAFFVNGVGDNAKWQPAVPASGGPGYDNGGPSPNNFGPGANTVELKVGNAPSYNTPVNVPNRSLTSIQFYMLLRDAMTVEWFLSVDGTVFDSSYGKMIALAPA
jgi:hypothetical protein